MRQTLRGEYVFDFTRSNAKRECAKRAVRAGMTVATDDRHARLSQTQLRPNHVHDALFGRVDVEQLNAKLFAVAAECFHLIGRYRIGDWQTAIRRGDIMINRSESEIRTTNSSARLSQALKRLGRRHLVDEV